jgi:hypothetical protein
VPDLPPGYSRITWYENGEERSVVTLNSIADIYRRSDPAISPHGPLTITTSDQERAVMELTADHFSREGITDADLELCPALADGYVHGDDVRPKFDSVAAAILWQWSLDSGQNEDCGDAQYGNGWHALFRDERAILHTGNSGFVSAWRVDPDKDLDAEWAEIEAGAVTEDGPDFFDA